MQCSGPIARTLHSRRPAATAFLVAVAVVTSMDTEVLIVGIFVSAGVLSYVIIPGLLGMEGPGARSHGSNRGEGSGEREVISPNFFSEQ